MSALTAPAGGLIERLPFDEYVGMPEVHATGLKDILVSPLLFRRRQEIPRQDKDALRVGRGCHTATLEPDRFPLEYAVWLKKEGRRGTNKHKAFVAANAGRTMLTEAQYYQATNVRDAVRSHAIARELLKSGRPEVSIRWKHERSGLWCKSRIDWLRSEVVDLKTTRDPSPPRFSGDAARFGYAMQIAFYIDAVRAATGKFLRGKIIAAQNIEPYDVVVYDVSDELYTIGKEQYEGAIDKLLECQATGQWPGLAPSEEVTLHLPAWATPEAEEEQPTMNGEALFEE